MLNICSWKKLDGQRAWAPSPTEGSQCEVCIDCTFDKALLTEHKLQHTCDKRVICLGDATNWFEDAIEACLEKMKEGDTFELHIPLATLSGNTSVFSPLDKENHANSTALVDTKRDVEDNCDTEISAEKRPAVPMSKTHCVLQVKLMSFVRKPDIWKLSGGEKFSSASHYKQIGLQLYKKNCVEWAFRHFSKALKYLLLIGPSSDVPEHLQSAYTTLKIQCHLNLAACQLQRLNYSSVILNCNHALALQADHVKGLYRRAQAFTALHDHDRAAEDLKRVLQGEPGNAAATQLLATVQHSKAEGNKRMAKALSKMFNES